MHPEALHFVMSVAPPVIGKRVIEFGSHNVNGSIRALFPGAYYVGIDPWPGDGVDVVARCQDYTPTHLADVVVSTEALEHDADAIGHLDAAWRCLLPGGLFILTCAGPNRQPHGCSGGPLPTTEHYGNIDPTWLQTLLIMRGWQGIDVRYNAQSCDTYAIARKAV